MFNLDPEFKNKSRPHRLCMSRYPAEHPASCRRVVEETLRGDTEPGKDQQGD